MANHNGLGRPGEDREVYKIRVKCASGSKSVYRTSPDSAFDYAQKCKDEGTLVYFARYTLEEVIVK